MNKNLGWKFPPLFSFVAKTVKTKWLMQHYFVKNFNTFPAVSKFIKIVKSVCINGVEYTSNCYLCVAVSEDDVLEVCEVDSVFVNGCKLKCFLLD